MGRSARGRIFVSDVRSLEQLSAFHTNVVLQQSPGAGASRAKGSTVSLDVF